MANTTRYPLPDLNTLPEDIRAKLPTDGASQHDHYIYGVPKREQ